MHIPFTAALHLLGLPVRVVLLETSDKGFDVPEATITPGRACSAYIIFGYNVSFLLIFMTVAKLSNINKTIKKHLSYSGGLTDDTNCYEIVCKDKRLMKYQIRVTRLFAFLFPSPSPDKTVVDMMGRF